MPSRPKPQDLIVIAPRWAIGKEYGNLYRQGKDTDEWYRDKTKDLKKRQHLRAKVEAVWAKLGFERVFPEPEKAQPIQRTARRLSDPELKFEDDVVTQMKDLTLQDDATADRPPLKPRTKSKPKPKPKTDPKPSRLKQPDLGEFEPPERWVDFVAKRQHKLEAEKQQREVLSQAGCDCSEACEAPPVPMHLRDPTADLRDLQDAEYDPEQAALSAKAFEHLVCCRRWRSWMRDGTDRETTSVQELVAHFAALKRGKGLVDLYLNDRSDLAASAYRDRSGTIKVLATDDTSDELAEALDQAGIRARVHKVKSVTKAGIAGLTLAHGLSLGRARGAAALARVAEFAEALPAPAQLRYVF
jgi:hypothetical protein